MIPKIFVSVYPFAREDQAPLNLLESNGWQIKVNSAGRKLTAQETSDLAFEFDGIIAGTEDLKPLINKSQRLKMISRVGIGLDNVPLEICRDRNIQVSYTPDAVTPAVVEMVIGLMVSVSRKVCRADREIREGKWPRHYGKRIGESVIGIIGFGRVGNAVASYLPPFKPAQVLVNDIKDKSKEIHALAQTGLNVRFSAKEEIYLNSDIITLHTPLTKQTNQMFAANEINKMKSDAFLINTARGQIINEEDLYQALNSNRIAGAALDVFDKEPYKGNLSQLENVILTQHMGSCSYDCRKNMEMQAVEEIIRFFQGKPLKRTVPAEEFEYQVS